MLVFDEMVQVTPNSHKKKLPRVHIKYANITYSRKLLLLFMKLRLFPFTFVIDLQRLDL